MAIADTSPIRHLGFNGFADPALPNGMWDGVLSLTGDASGDELSMSLIFAETAAAQNERFYNIEWLSWRHNINTALNGILNVINFQQSASRTFGLQIIASSANTGGAAANINALSLPIWLGAQDNGATNARIEMASENNLNDSQRLIAGGYWWGPEAILADGGPQRPQTSLFR